MDEKVDHGPIIKVAEIPISPKDNYLSLEKSTASLAAKMIIEILPDFVRGKIKTTLQNHQLATYTKKFSGSDAEVDLKKDSSVDIERKIRALNPEPGVYTETDRGRIKIIEAENRAGKIMIKKIQFAGKKIRPIKSEEANKIFNL